jgi:hypothetical protein
MITLQDLKQALDTGKTITDQNDNEVSMYSGGGGYYLNETLYDWHQIESLFSHPSLWRIRDQIGATPAYNGTGANWIEQDEKGQYKDPAMMVVPIDEWNALQDELKKAREIPPFIQQVLSIQNETIDGFVTWMDGLTEVDKIFLLNAWLHIRQYMNNDAREWEQIRKRIYP